MITVEDAAVRVLVAIVKNGHQYSTRCSSSNSSGTVACDVRGGIHDSRKSLTGALLVNLNCL